MQLVQIVQTIDGLLWLIILLFPFNFIQKRVHAEIQVISFLLTRNRRLSLIIFAVLLFPGVFLHEFSHLISARLLGVKTGRFSVIPKSFGESQLQLGYVETSNTDWVRGSIIGAAPLITGGTLIAYLSSKFLDLPFLWDLLFMGNLNLFWTGIVALTKIKYFWLFVYLIFVVSTTMMPSISDRHSWLPMGFTIAILIIIMVIIGAGPWMLETVAPAFNSILKGLAMVLGISALLHLILLIPAGGIHKILIKISGYDIR